MLGIWTRWAALFCFCNILVAWALLHRFAFFGRGPGPEHGELIVLYLVALLTLVATGSTRSAWAACAADSSRREASYNLQNLLQMPSAIHTTALVVFCLCFLVVTAAGFLAARWRRADLHSLEEWGLAGRSFGTLIAWFLIGGDFYTAYTVIAVPAAL